ERLGRVLRLEPTFPETSDLGPTQARLGEQAFHRIAAQVQTENPRHQLSLQYTNRPRAWSSILITASIVFCTEPASPTDLMLKVLVLSLTSRLPWTLALIDALTGTPASLSKAPKSFTDIPIPGNTRAARIRRIRSSMKYGSANCGGTLVGSTIERMASRSSSGSSVLMFNLELMSLYTVSRSLKAAMKRSFTPCTM